MKLVLGNSYSRLEGLTAPQFKELRDLLSYTVDSMQPGKRWKQESKRYLIDKKGNFPSGLLTTVETWLANNDYGVDDNRIKPTLRRVHCLSRIDGPAPYQEQKDAVSAARCCERGTIVMPTGTGKSYVIALLVSVMELRTLIVVPTLALKLQLQSSFKGWFGDTEHITIENIDSPKLKDAKDYDCLIIDEAHRVAAATYRNLNRTAWTGIYHRFFFTATPFRAREEEQMLMEALSGEVIYRLPYQVAVDKGLIVPVEAYYYDLPKQVMKGNPRSWPAVYSELIVNNVIRNELIIGLMQALEYRPTLCLVKEILHGERLSLASGYPFASGSDGRVRERILEFCLGEQNTLIGTTGVLGEGVDTKPAEWIILAAGGKAKTQFMQQVGRGVRNSPGKTSCKVIMFRDSSNPWLLKHFNACVKYLKDEYSVRAMQIPLPDGF